MHVVDVEAAALRAVHSIRSGNGPRFIEAKTYRFRAHSMFDPDLYRDKAEIEERKKHGPILQFQKWAIDTHTLTVEQIAAIEAEVAAEIEEAVGFAEQAAWEPVEDLTRDVYTRVSATQPT